MTMTNDYAVILPALTKEGSGGPTPSVGPEPKPACQRGRDLSS